MVRILLLIAVLEVLILLFQFYRWIQYYYICWIVFRLKFGCFRAFLRIFYGKDSKNRVLYSQLTTTAHQNPHRLRQIDHDSQVHIVH